MDATVEKPSTENKTWNGGNKPLNASYGKIMMWFFIVSDALTFSGFLAAYGFSRFKFIDSWPIADEVFTHIPFIHGNFPMYYVAFMTFILIFSSVTMVLAVDAGHHLKKNISNHLSFSHYHRRFNFCWFSSMGMEHFYKRKLWSC